MEKELKYRIVGASVLVLLGVIFIPMILSPSDEIHGVFDDTPPLGANDGFHSRIVPTDKSVAGTEPPKVFDQTGVRHEIPIIRREIESITPVQRELPAAEPDRKAVWEEEINRETALTETTKPAEIGNRWSQDRDKPDKNEGKAVIAKREIPTRQEPEQKVSTPQKPKQKAATPQEPMAWAVQVGSFVKRGNALGLRDLLQTKGYRAFVEFVPGGNGGVTRTRVFVGPELDRENAQKSARKLRTDLSIKGIVVRYFGG
uniref:Cell division protein DedD (Protein involved in septation) n=1 Tax=Candidatus Kentrum sp. FW TaxID=2126338 RepID=A0A450SQ16_9GAMM|nr:MAG: Cell division protein DedD (protein involved in septation) [Candidatus Kentron sp. FW]